MPGKKKKGKTGSRPEFQHQDSTRRDIEAAQANNLNVISSHESGDVGGAEDGLDLADELLAILDARDQASAEVQKTTRAETDVLRGHNPPEKTKSAMSGESEASQNSASTSRRGPGEMLMHAGEKIFGHHHARSPPPAGADDPEADDSPSTEMQRKGSIRDRLFGTNSSNQEDGLAGETGKKKVSRQRARKVRESGHAWVMMAVHAPSRDREAGAMARVPVEIQAIALTSNRKGPLGAYGRRCYA